MRKGLAASVLLALLMTGAAQSAPPAHPDPVTASQYDELEKNLSNLAALTYGGGGFNQTLSMLGREDLAAQVPLPAFRIRPECKPLLEDGKPVEPVAYIAARAAQARVTLINEAHDESLSRSFLMKVAAALHAKGYTGYAAETFNPQIGIEGPAWPRVSDGYYSREPAYGRLIRQLRGEKYRLLSYEFSPLDDPKVPFPEQMNQRMAGQAANLIGHLRREAKDAKILVHAGYANLSKMPTNQNGNTHMGYEFARISGVYPLSVDQVMFQAPGDDFVVCDLTQVEPRRIYTEIMIGAPKPRFVRGRAAWRLALGDRFADIPVKLLRKDAIAVYDARPVGEPADSVPMDRILLRPGETLPLLLPPGRYNVTAWTQKAGWSAGVSLTVAGKAAAKSQHS